MNEKYNHDSIIFLKELYEREDSESKKLKRKRDISRSSDYNERISYHEWRKKLIKYLIVSTRSINRGMDSSPSHKNKSEDKRR